jgi:hypothetical protein
MHSPWYVVPDMDEDFMLIGWIIYDCVAKEPVDTSVAGLYRTRKQAEQACKVLTETYYAQRDTEHALEYEQFLRAKGKPS